MKKFIQISSGRGPEECCFAVAQVLKKIIKECKAYDCYYEVINREPSDINGNLHSASLWIDTKNRSDVIDTWIGTVQWVSQSPFRIHHKRKNWFIGVFEISNTKIKDIDFNDVTYEAFRSGGPGGQNVNKVSSAVRAIHRPTGLAVKVMDTRSQLQNKRLATERLKQAWSSFQLEKIKELNDTNWNNHLNLERGNPVKVFKAKDFKLKAPTKNIKTNVLKTNKIGKKPRVVLDTIRQLKDCIENTPQKTKKMEHFNNYLIKALDAYPYNLEEAIDALNYAISYEPNNPIALGLYGRIYMDVYDDCAKAIGYFEEALGEEIHTISIYGDYLSALIRNEDFEKAKRFIKFALTVKGVDKALLFAKKALVFEYQQHYKKAIKTIKKSKTYAYNDDFMSYADDFKKRVKRKMPKAKASSNKKKKSLKK